MTANNIWGAAAFVLMLAFAPAASAEQGKAETKEKPATPAKLEVAPNPPESKGEHPFAGLVGSWSGGGTLSLSSGSRERLRCRAHHRTGRSGRSLALRIRCASDSYRFDLTSTVVNRRGRIFGRWNESSHGLSGTVAGRAAAGRIRALARSDTFTAGLSITTKGRRQSVSITPRDTFIRGIYIALRKR